MQCKYCGAEIEQGKLCAACEARIIASSRNDHIDTLRARGISDGSGGGLRVLLAGVGIAMCLVFLWPSGNHEATLSHEGKRDIAVALGVPTSTKVIAFVADYCPACRYTESYLHEQGIAYVRADIEKDAQAKEAFRQLSRKVSIGSGIPRLVVGNSVLVGFNAQKFSEALAAAK
jgi:glutaredoxin